jgi:hypothetical protein
MHGAGLGVGSSHFTFWINCMQTALCPATRHVCWEGGGEGDRNWQSSLLQIMNRSRGEA